MNIVVKFYSINKTSFFLNISCYIRRLTERCALYMSLIADLIYIMKMKYKLFIGDTS